jgi:DNA-directed RNA polymerase specialized sigma24 family protein
MSAARSVGGRRKRLRSGAFTSESKLGGLTAGPLAGAMPASSLSPVVIPVAIPVLSMPPVAQPARPVSALGRSAAAGESDADRAVTAMYGTQYRRLVRLTVLLVGDLRTAEEIVQDSFAAMHQTWRRLRNQDAALAFLHWSVLARSRSAAPGPALAVAPRYESPADEASRPPHRAVPLRAADPAGAAEPSGTGAPTPAARQAGAADPAGVVAALQRLPVMQREALALRLYLDLPDDQIAAAMRVSHATARDNVAGGLAALRGVA